MTTIINILVWLTIIGNLIIFTYLLDFLLYKFKLKKSYFKLWEFFGKRALIFGFFITFVATFGSLYFSDVLGYYPCKLCWYQRIFMYPQLFLFGIAMWWSEKRFIWKNIIILSIVGALIASFHYYIQISTKPIFNLPCSSVGYSTLCSETFITYFGYITIPMMALTAFILLIILGTISLIKQ